VKLADGWRLESEVNLLEDIVGPVEPSFLPFKVRSWTMVRG